MPRAAKPLTEARIRAAKPSSREHRLYDGRGLYLSVMPTGSKLWRIKYRDNDAVEHLVGAGSYPDVSLAAARAAREQLKLDVRGGKDPIAARREVPVPRASTFRAVADEWFAYVSRRWAPSTTEKARDYLDNDILPALGDKPPRAISRADLIDLQRRIEDRGAFNAAEKVRQWLGQIFRYALVLQKVDSNPATDLDVVAAPAPPPRPHPHVPFREVPELLETLDRSAAHQFIKSSVYLLLLTAARPAELRLAGWNEFDLDGGTWTVPAHRMKMRRPHVIPLSRQAVNILRDLQKVTSHYPFIAPGRLDPNRPLSDAAVNKALADIGYKGRQTGHGFRYVMSTELNERDYDDDWIEAQLAHGDPDKIRGTYNKAAYLAQRRTMMQAWADLIDVERAKHRSKPLSG